MDLLLSLALSTAPVVPASPAASEANPGIDLEFAQAVLMAEHRLAMPIFVLEDAATID
jgi:hypothetical protein